MKRRVTLSGGQYASLPALSWRKKIANTITNHKASVQPFGLDRAGQPGTGERPIQPEWLHRLICNKLYKL